MTTIYALMFCYSMTSCQLNRPPIVFESLQECRQMLAQLQQRPVGEDGRIYVNDKAWWQCAAKRVETWELR